MAISYSSPGGTTQHLVCQLATVQDEPYTPVTQIIPILLLYEEKGRRWGHSGR